MKKYAIISIIIVFLVIPFITRGIKGQTQTDKENADLMGVRYVLKSGDTVIDILRKSHLDKTVIDSVIKMLELQVDPKSIKPEEEIYIFTDKQFNFKRLEYKRNISEIYSVEFDNRFTTKRKNVERKISVAVISGEIEDNIYLTFKRMGERDDLSSKFAKVFEWRFDAYSDVQKGDKIVLLIEKVFINDQFFEYGKILYASFENKENLYEAFYYKDDKVEGHFDENGVSLEGTIMKAPLSHFTRISSKYTSRRFHPILKRYLPHNAIDYSAPRGTPVYAAGDGYILQKVYDLEGGKTIKISHENGYQTEYCHLYKYASSIKVGKYVKQGEVIGYVGRTGYATGSHLHYAVKLNGKYVNPAKLKFENAKQIMQEDVEKYCYYVDIVRSFVLAAKSMMNFPNISSKKEFLFKYADITDKSAGL